MENTYQAGNTIRLTCTFKDFDGTVKKDPDLIKVKIYDQKYSILHEYIVTITNKTGVGDYFWDYTIPLDVRGKLYYEWYGEIAGSASLHRQSIKVVFV
jgi:hypothetical protein